MRASRVVGLLVALIVITGIGLTVLDRSDCRAPSAPESDEQRQQAAAVDAATRFLLGLDAETLLDEEVRRRFVGRWASKQSEASLQLVYDEEATRIELLNDGYSRAAPLGYRVEELGADSATVAVWAVSLAGLGDFPVLVGWRTVSVGLVVEGGHWRVSTVTDTSGPTPDVSFERFRADSERFREYRLVP